MHIKMPWEKCRSCGKNLIEGKNFTLDGNEEHIHVVLTCDNPKCKDKGKRQEFILPRHLRM